MDVLVRTVRMSPSWTSSWMTVRGGRARLLDWGEAAVSHPFAGLVNTLRDFTYRRRLEPEGREMLRLRDIYLEPWSRFAPSGELRETFKQGYLFGVGLPGVGLGSHSVASACLRARQVRQECGCLAQHLP